ncbi:MAG: preprotein translocase subunit SecG [Patescibacteria group bacterium]
MIVNAHVSPPGLKHPPTPLKTSLYTYRPILLQAIIPSQYLASKYAPTLTINFLYANIQKANLILHMKNILNILQIVISILLIVTILLQQKGSGLGATFGGDSAIYRTKRGAEKFIFRLTIVLSFLFLASALASLFIS